MNIEKLEYDLTLLEDKPVVLIAPSFGHVSFSYAGTLSVTTTPEFTVGFHLANQMGGVAIIFFADDVTKLEAPSKVCNTHIIRLKGPNDYKESFVAT